VVQRQEHEPLLNLYLLPIILSAFTLGRLVTLMQVAVIAICHVILAAATPGLDVISLFYASRLVGQLAPFLLVAYLTTTLSADITERGTHRESGSNRRADRSAQFAHVQRSMAARTRLGRARPGVYALLMIDMDKLKDINDTFGHEAGNSAITLVAQCLQRSIRNTDHARVSAATNLPCCFPAPRPKWPRPWSSGCGTMSTRPPWTCVRA